jgi:hypothetical protein
MIMILVLPLQHTASLSQRTQYALYAQELTNVQQDGIAPQKELSTDSVKKRVQTTMQLSQSVTSTNSA